MRIAIITGASSGIGKEFVQYIIKRGDVDEVWAVARNEVKLCRLQNEMGAKLRPFSVDISNIDDIKRFQNVLEKEKPNVAFLVNSAGFGKFCAYEDISIEESLAMIDTNCKGLVAMTLTVLPYMKEHASIINLGSAAAFQPLPYENLYASSKAFVRNYSRALNRELKTRKILVTCVCPSWVETDFFNVALSNNGTKRATNYSGMVTPESVVKKAMKDSFAGRDMSVCGTKTKVLHALAKLLPQSIMINLWLKQQKL